MHVHVHACACACAARLRYTYPTLATPTYNIQSGICQRMRAVSPSAFLVNSLPYVNNWSPEDELDASNVHKPLLTQSYEAPDGGGRGSAVYRRISAVNWKNIITIAVTVVDYLFVYASISLIGTFFPTEVNQHEQIIVVCYFWETGKIINLYM